MSTSLCAIAATALAARLIEWHDDDSIVPPSSELPAVPAPREVPEGESFSLIAVGDVAGPGMHHMQTAALAERLVAEKNVSLILLLGDTQYPNGALRQYRSYFAPSWGRPSLIELTRPVPGNHEYNHGLSNAAGYFDFFNGRGQPTGPAGVRGQGYYSFEMGDWHVVALNTSDGCKKVRCEPGSPMYEWLRADLIENERKCVLATMHHPRFQQGAHHLDTPRVAPLWDLLYEARADVVLAGHDHNYQQMAPLNREGEIDLEHGIRSFVVGTGGGNPYQSFDLRLRPQAVEAKAAGRFGMLLMRMGDGEYGWDFVATTPSGAPEVLATGQDVCR